MTVNSSTLSIRSNRSDQTHPGDTPAGSAALCAIARFHQVAADPATLAHQLGLSPNHPLTKADLLYAAKHLGLKASRADHSVRCLCHGLESGDCGELAVIDSVLAPVAIYQRHATSAL